MRAKIMEFLEALEEEAFYNEEAEEWQFRDGAACFLCSSSAIQVARQFGGLVFGYYSSDNPTAHIGSHSHDGHDFALIDDRWLVDYWAWRVERLITTPIFDLREQSDRTDIHRLYGDAERWSLVHSFVHYGQE